MNARRRSRWTSLAVLTAIATLVAVVALGCGGGGSGDSSPSRAVSFQLPVLDLVPLSGDLSTLGQSGKKAADLAVLQVRGAIRRVGARQSIDIVHVDDRSDPKAGIAAAKAASAKRPPACLTGSWTTPVTIAALNEIAIPQGVLQITPAATADELTGLADEGLLQRTAMPDSYEGRALADVIDENLGGAGGRTVSVGYENSSYGKGIAAAFVKSWRAKGGVVVGPVAYQPAAKAYADVAARIVPAGKDVDAYALFGFASSYQKLAPALLSTGRWSPGQTYGPDALAIRSLPAAAGADATEGLRGTAPGAPEGTPATEAFDRLYDRTGGPKRQAFDAQLFDAVVLCYLSAVKAGRADGKAMAATVRQISAPPGQKYTWQQLPQAIHALEQGREIDYDGASGPIDMNSAGDATAGAYDLFRFRGGRLEVYDQVPVGQPASGG
jgi:ABC-type branched-subunit amino acid transport system substrate-binding protein